MICINSLQAQKSVKLFSGVNYTTTKNSRYDFGKLNKSESYTNDPIFLPHFGFEYNIPLKNKFSFTTGLGVSMMGCKNFIEKIDFTLIDSTLNPEIIEFWRSNPDLKIIYLRAPLFIQYELINGLSIFGGYTIQYSVRKSQNFAAIGNLNELPPKVKFIYRNFHHALNFGIQKNWKNFSISANYHLGINRITDTEDFDPNIRVYRTLYGLQFSVGYLILE
jgi:hypothetical protein